VRREQFLHAPAKLGVPSASFDQITPSRFGRRQRERSLKDFFFFMLGPSSRVTPKRRQKGSRLSDFSGAYMRQRGRLQRLAGGW